MIRKARLADLDTMYDIRLQASKRMHLMGIDQWQDIHPTKDQFLEDIKKEQAFVYESNEGIQGIISLQIDPEYAYESLVDISLRALTCHRLAVADDALGKGYAKEMLLYMESYAQHHKINILYVDTHPNNIPMRKLLKSISMQPVGIILDGYQNASERILYQKRLEF
jgi:RimJ/RimL family protein N-acetyltransferase